MNNDYLANAQGMEREGGRRKQREREGETRRARRMREIRETGDRDINKGAGRCERRTKADKLLMPCTSRKSTVIS